MPRGRLIFPFLVDLAQLDTAATAADPDVGGPLTSGYDDDFREPVRLLPGTGGSEQGSIVREENIVTLKAQIEPSEFENFDAQATGRSVDSKMGLIFHYKDLEAAGMVEGGTGRPKLRGPGDRLDAIRHVKTGALIEKIPATPGLYATEVQSRGFGIGPFRNLLLVIFEERDVSLRSA